MSQSEGSTFILLCSPLFHGSEHLLLSVVDVLLSSQQLGIFSFQLTDRRFGSLSRFALRVQVRRIVGHVGCGTLLFQAQDLCLQGIALVLNDSERLQGL